MSESQGLYEEIRKIRIALEELVKLLSRGSR